MRREKKKKGERESRGISEHCYRNSSAQNAARSVKKKSNCGNAIAEKGKKKFVLTIVAIAENGKKIYDICEWVKKKVVTYTILLQYFHNKSHMINYYYFKKFVTN